MVSPSTQIKNVLSQAAGGRPSPREINEDRLRFATRAAQIGIWEFDYEKETFWRNETHDLLFGFTEMQEEWNYERFLSILHPEDREHVKQTLGHSLKSENHWSLQYRVIWPDQSVHWIEANGQVDRNIDGRKIRLVGANIDVTEKKKIEEERLSFAHRAQVDLNNLKSEREFRERFVSTLTHDLRNPLMAIKISAQILLKNLKIVEGSNRAALRIISSVNRADRMIQDLLDANRIRARQQLPIQINICNLLRLLEDTIDELVLIHGDRFVLHCPETIEGYWDHEQLRRVVENLSNNAAKYGSESSPITISVDPSSEWVELCVHNFGGELSTADQETLFEPYRRTQAADASRQKGWGIGLTLCRGIIEAHGGSIKVVSHPSHGTSFKALIPRDSRHFQQSPAQSEIQH